jgi:hypothetical protein
MITSMSGVKHQQHELRLALAAFHSQQPLAVMNPKRL